MALVELSVVEQRYRAVLMVDSKGASVTEVAVQFEVSRQTGAHVAGAVSSGRFGRFGGSLHASGVESATGFTGGGGDDL